MPPASFQSLGTVYSVPPERPYPQAMEHDLLHHPMVCSGVVPLATAFATAHTIYHVIKTLLRPKKGRARRAQLAEVCAQWHVEHGPEDRAVCKVAQQMLASVLRSTMDRDEAPPKAPEPARLEQATGLSPQATEVLSSAPSSLRSCRSTRSSMRRTCSTASSLPLPAPDALVQYMPLQLPISRSRPLL